MHRAPWLLVLLTLPFGLHAEDAPQYSPWADQELPMQVFWGDTHLHSSWSPDAGAGGNIQITPEDASSSARLNMLSVAHAVDRTQRLHSMPSLRQPGYPPPS